jgi:hypothetical protein
MSPGERFRVSALFLKPLPPYKSVCHYSQNFMMVTDTATTNIEASRTSDRIFTDRIFTDRIFTNRIFTTLDGDILSLTPKQLEYLRQKREVFPHDGKWQSRDRFI